VKFAWSRPAALRLAREIGVLTALTREPRVPYLPEVVASSSDPVLLITRLIPGDSLFEVIDSIDPDRAGQQLARFLAALHDVAARRRAEAIVGPLSGAHLPPVTTQALRERFVMLVRPDQRELVMRWCTVTCTATTRYGTTTSSGWWWISRPSELPSRSMTCAPFPVQLWDPALSC
jgi:hypothetical protein